MPRSNKFLIAGGVIITIAFLSYGGYRYWKLYDQNVSLLGKIGEVEKENFRLQKLVASTTIEFSNAQKDNSELSQSLQAEQSKNNVFEASIKDISGTIDTLKKLSEIDPQLLKKYSKIYFLNENYAPANLSAIDSQYLYNEKKPELIHPAVLPYLTGMMEAAKRDGITLQIVSGYRSFYEQANVKTGYDMTYGTGTANQFSADQGYSEHQLGTALDFTSPENKAIFLGFEKTAAYKWLAGNIYKFGFILSYPQNNSYYIFEPWHWRFVGVSLATTLHNNGEYFYNMGQAEIDKYLISIFD